MCVALSKQLFSTRIIFCTESSWRNKESQHKNSNKKTYRSTSQKCYQIHHLTNSSRKKNFSLYLPNSSSWRSQSPFGRECQKNSEYIKEMYIGISKGQLNEIKGCNHSTWRHKNYFKKRALKVKWRDRVSKGTNKPYGQIRQNTPIHR